MVQKRICFLIFFGLAACVQGFLTSMENNEERKYIPDPELLEPKLDDHDRAQFDDFLKEAIEQPNPDLIQSISIRSISPSLVLYMVSMAASRCGKDDIKIVGLILAKDFELQGISVGSLRRVIELVKEFETCTRKNKIGYQGVLSVLRRHAELRSGSERMGQNTYFSMIPAEIIRHIHLFVLGGSHLL